MRPTSTINSSGTLTHRRAAHPHAAVARRLYDATAWVFIRDHKGFTYESMAVRR